MHMVSARFAFASLLLSGLLTACGAPDGPASGEAIAWQQQALETVEGFEGGSKGSYVTGDVTLASGTWTFSDALIGTLPADQKSGAKSARLRLSGRLTLQSDRANVGTVT